MEGFVKFFQKLNMCLYNKYIISLFTVLFIHEIFFNVKVSQRYITSDGGRGGPGWAMVPPKIRKKKIEVKKIIKIKIKKKLYSLVLILVI